MRILAGTALALIVGGCAVPSTTTNDQQANNQSLAGPWQGSNSGLSVLLALQQAGDSVTGSGTFDLGPNASLGCGGETLPSKGTVNLKGRIQGTEFQGRMTFADVWTPPFVGTWSRPDSLVGHFMSIDRGGCPLVLVRKK